MKKCYRLAGCFTCLYTLTGLVFYIILMVNKFNAGVDWLTGFFLIFGLVGIVIIGPMLTNLFFFQGCVLDMQQNTCCCKKYENKEDNEEY